MTITKIEDLQKVQIICQYPKQILECFEYLKQLGFDVEDFTKYYDGRNVIYWENNHFTFSSVLNENLIIEFYNKKLRKTLEKFIKEKKEKEKVEDIEFASDGRVIKINNFTSEKEIFICTSMCISMKGDKIKELEPTWLEYVVKLGLVYATQEAMDKAVFKLEIETKLKNIAERLNKGQKIDWKDINQNKYKIFYDKIINYDYNFYEKCQGVIYCLDRSFLEVAKQEIGEENLIKYFEGE